MTDLSALKTDLNSRLGKPGARITLNAAFFSGLSFKPPDDLDGVIQRALFPGGDPNAATGKLTLTRGDNPPTFDPETPTDTLTVSQVQVPSLLGVENAACVLRFTLSNGRLDFTLTTCAVSLPGTNLPLPVGFPGEFFSFGSDSQAFIFSTADDNNFAWKKGHTLVGTLTLVQGLNFAAVNTIAADGPLKIVLDLVMHSHGDTDIIIYGYIRPNSDTGVRPDLELAAKLSGTVMSVGFLKLSNPRVGIQMLLNQSPTVFFAVDFAVGDGESNELYAVLNNSGIPLLQFGIVPRDSKKPITLATLLGQKSGSGGGTTLSSWWDTIPSGKIIQQVVSSVGLYHLSATAAYGASPKIVDFQLIAGTATPIEVGSSDFIIKSATVTWNCLDPMGTVYNAFSFNAQFKLFGYNFGINFTDTTISGSSYDEIGLDALLDDPPFDLSFDDVYIKWTYKDPKQLELSATLNASFPILDKGAPFAIDNLAFNFSKSGSVSSLKQNPAVDSQLNVHFAGIIIIDAYVFEVTGNYIKKGPNAGHWSFEAIFDGVIPLSALINGLFEDLGIDFDLPDISLSNPSLTFNTGDTAAFGISAGYSIESITGTFQLECRKNDDITHKWEFAAVLELTPGDPVDLGAKLPLVGSEIAGDFELKGASLIFTSNTSTSNDVITIPGNPNLKITPGVSFAFDFVLAGQAHSLTLPVIEYHSAQPRHDTLNAAPVVDAPAPHSDQSKKPSGNIPIQKKIGPIFIDSISITYANQVLTCSLSASMTLGPMTVSMDGLSLGTSLTDFKPEFNLAGLGFSYDTSALTVEGAILKVPDTQLPTGVELQFDGALIVRAEEWGLSALASYAQMTDGLPSMFIFVDVEDTLGGPPYFIVEGVMGGFGYNRSLAMPSFDQVRNFPLLAIGGPQTGSAKDIAMSTLEILEGQKAGANGQKKQWIAPKEGDYWIAAGIKFSSFEIVDGELLAIAEFGNDMQFAILGLAWLSLPKGAAINDAFVYVELQMEAVLKPADGYFSVAGSLTNNSFVLTKECHLTGGFAFDLWFGDNPHSGQFVMTVGGYHPAFKAPAFFPKVKRLGFNWQVSGDVTIKGESYFAVTPSCGMAGGRLEALYHSGDVKAWFNEEANFLVTWKPFSFIADISINIGASVRVNLLVCHKTVSVSLGASLNLWGPPLGGKVKVHVVVVTVTIHFGSDSALDNNKKALTWEEFESLLPKPGNDRKNVCKIVANSGLTKKLKKGDTEKWVVRSGTFGFTTQSAVPAGGNISIRPMFKTGVTSTHNLQITKNTPGGNPIDMTNWTRTPVNGQMAETLWGQPLTEDSHYVQGPSAPSSDTVELLNGYMVRTPAPVLGPTFGLVPISQLMEEYIAPGKAQNPLSTHPATSTTYEPAAGNTTITDIEAMATTGAANRNLLYTVLKANTIYAGSNDGMKGMATNAADMFTAEPMEYT